MAANEILSDLKNIAHEQPREDAGLPGGSTE